MSHQQGPCLSKPPSQEVTALLASSWEPRGGGDGQPGPRVGSMAVGHGSVPTGPRLQGGTRLHERAWAPAAERSE